jgi:hypothetical protein
VGEILAIRRLGPVGRQPCTVLAVLRGICGEVETPKDLPVDGEYSASRTRFPRAAGVLNADSGLRLTGFRARGPVTCGEDEPALCQAFAELFRGHETPFDR